jgi:hypothetical protein
MTAFLVWLRTWGLACISIIVFVSVAEAIVEWRFQRAQGIERPWPQVREALRAMWRWHRAEPRG